MNRIPRGFAALVPVLLLSAVLLMLALASASGAYLARLEALEAEYAAQARMDAHTCGQVALFELAADPSYAPPAGGHAVWLTSESACRIESVTRAGMTRVIVSGTKESMRVTLEMLLDPVPGEEPPFVLTSLREI